MLEDKAADRLRALLSDLQEAVYAEADVPEDLQERLINLISVQGFRLVDELQGVIR